LTVVAGSIDHSVLSAARTANSSRYGLIQRSSSQASLPRQMAKHRPQLPIVSHSMRLTGLPGWLSSE